LKNILLTDEYLRGENQLDDHVIHLLFSTNRWEKSQELIKTLVSLLPSSAEETHMFFCNGCQPKLASKTNILILMCR